MLTTVPAPTELLGYAAACLVLATFSVRSLIALRSVAIASNLMFIGYAAAAGLLPVLILHGLLLPLNGLRLRQALAQRPHDPPPPAAQACRRPVQRVKSTGWRHKGAARQIRGRLAPGRRRSAIRAT